MLTGIPGASPVLRGGLARFTRPVKSARYPNAEQREMLSRVALVQSVRDARRAYENWFDSLQGRRKGPKISHPRPKRKRTRQSVRLTRNGFSVRRGRFEPTSQVCSACGVKDGPKPLSIRTWTCAACGTVHDRDVNAAKNILAAGRADRLNPCGAGIRPHLVAVGAEAGTHRSAA